MNKVARPIISIFLGFLVSALILKFLNLSISETFFELISGAFSKPQYISYIIIKSTPIILTGLSVAFAFQTGMFNIGSEGQFIIGSITATCLGIIFNFEAPIQIPLIFLFSILFSAFYGGIAGLLKAFFGIHEVISSIMLNWIALFLSNYLVMHKSFHRIDTESTEYISQNSSIVLFENFKNSNYGIEWLTKHPFLKDFLRPSFNFGIFIAITISGLIWILLNKTTFGFKLKSVGKSDFASKYAGINTPLKKIYAMMIAGGISGLAGAIQVLGVAKNSAILATHEGHGFDGIAVSLIGLNHPIGVFFSGLFLGTIKYSGNKLQSSLEIPSEIVSILIGVIIFFIAIPINLKLFKQKNKT